MTHALFELRVDVSAAFTIARLMIYLCLLTNNVSLQTSFCSTCFQRMAAGMELVGDVNVNGSFRKLSWIFFGKSR
jgi:hypothetical protein